MLHQFSRAAALAVSVAALGACGTGFNEMTGGDGGRGDALEVPLATLLYDRVDAERGDHTDWKRFVLEEDTELSIKVWWMAPANVKATVELRDQKGDLVKSAKHDGGGKTLRLGPVELTEGTYFIQFEAKSGASDYGFELTPKGGSSSGPMID
jgi:hypothetical protein